MRPVARPVTLSVNYERRLRHPLEDCVVPFSALAMTRAAVTGTRDRYDWNGKRPYHVVNFVTAHDGFTMFDLFAYTEKENGCGPLNPICCYDACSEWCDPTSGDSTIEAFDPSGIRDDVLDKVHALSERLLQAVDVLLCEFIVLIMINLKCLFLEITIWF